MAPTTPLGLYHLPFSLDTLFQHFYSCLRQSSHQHLSIRLSSFPRAWNPDLQARAVPLSYLLLPSICRWAVGMLKTSNAKSTHFPSFLEWCLVSQYSNRSTKALVIAKQGLEAVALEVMALEHGSQPSGRVLLASLRPDTPWDLSAYTSGPWVKVAAETKHFSNFLWSSLKVLCFSQWRNVQVWLPPRKTLPNYPASWGSSSQFCDVWPTLLTTNIIKR